MISNHQRPFHQHSIRLLHQYLKGQWTYNHRLPHKYLPGFSSDTGSDGRKRSTISSEPRWTRYLKWWKPQYSCAYPFHFWLRSSVQGRCQSLRWSHWWNKKRNKGWCWWSRLQPVTGPQEFFQRLQNLLKYKKAGTGHKNNLLWVRFLRNEYKNGIINLNPSRFAAAYQSQKIRGST